MVRLVTEQHPFECDNAEAIAISLATEKAAQLALFDEAVVLSSERVYRDNQLV